MSDKLDLEQILVIWSPGSQPIAAYKGTPLGRIECGMHAATMLGVHVTTLELRERVPEHVAADIESDFDGDDDTPVITVVVDVDGID